jgi:hypothetical protein
MIKVGQLRVANSRQHWDRDEKEMDEERYAVEAAPEAVKGFYTARDLAECECNAQRIPVPIGYVESVRAMIACRSRPSGQAQLKLTESESRSSSLHLFICYEEFSDGQF